MYLTVIRSLIVTDVGSATPPSLGSQPLGVSATLPFIMVSVIALVFATAFVLRLKKKRSGGTESNSTLLEALETYENVGTLSENQILSSS